MTKARATFRRATSRSSVNTADSPADPPAPDRDRLVGHDLRDREQGHCLAGGDRDAKIRGRLHIGGHLAHDHAARAPGKA